MVPGELKEVIQGCGKAMERKGKKGLKLRAQTRGMQRGWMLRVRGRKIVAIAPAAILFENSTCHVLHRWVWLNQRNSCDVI